MYELNLIGVNSEGIGFGNISARAGLNSFYISGTATGSFPALEEKHFALVNSWSFNNNSLTCEGKINASAESLSHAAIYETLPEVGAVIHIHHKKMWQHYLYSLPTTTPGIQYGTPEMAHEIQNVILNENTLQNSILVMGGHEEGLIAWGKTLDGAGELILKYFRLFLNEV